MKLTKEEGRDVVYEDHHDWETVESHVEDNSRWSIIHEGIFYHKPSEKYYSISWSVGATESQDERAFEYSEPIPIEVEKKQVTVDKWVVVKE